MSRMLLQKTRDEDQAQRQNDFLNLNMKPLHPLPASTPHNAILASVTWLGTQKLFQKALLSNPLFSYSSLFSNSVQCAMLDAIGTCFVHWRALQRDCCPQASWQWFIPIVVRFWLFLHRAVVFPHSYTHLCDLFYLSRALVGVSLMNMLDLMQTTFLNGTRVRSWKESWKLSTMLETINGVFGKLCFCFWQVSAKQHIPIPKSLNNLAATSISIAMTVSASAVWLFCPPIYLSPFHLCLSRQSLESISKCPARRQATIVVRNLMLRMIILNATLSWTWFEIPVTHSHFVHYAVELPLAMTVIM